MKPRISLLAILVILLDSLVCLNPLVYKGASSSMTQVEGLILANTTWTLSGSPYVVIDDVVVDQNVLLTIEPGVIVKFNEGKKLVIDGSLIARGTSSQIITFTSALLTPTPGCYEGVEMRGPAESPANLTLEHAMFEYARHAILFETNNTFTIKHVIFQENIFGLLVEVAFPYGCWVKVNLEDIKYTWNQPRIVGVLPRAIYGIGELVVNDSVISGAGILVGKMWMNNCTVSGIVADRTRYVSIDAWEATITNSRIVDNMNAGGVGVGTLYMYGTEVSNPLPDASNFSRVTMAAGRVANCTIRNLGRFAVRSFGPEATQIVGCVVTGNSNGIKVGFPGDMIQYKVPEIRSCIVTDNNGVGIEAFNSTVVDCIISRNAGGVRGYAASIEHCAIADNDLYGITAFSEYNYEGRLTVHNSNICNNSNYQLVNEAAHDVNATDNWWGTTNESLIDSSIYDYYDGSTSIGRVHYKPFLTSPIPDDPIPPEIRIVNASPTTPDQEQGVTVVANIADNAEVSRAILSYLSNSVWHNVTMNQIDFTFTATIPSQSAGTRVDYKVLASDASGNWASTYTYSYSVTGIANLPWVTIVLVAAVIIMLVVASTGLWIRRSRKKRQDKHRPTDTMQVSAFRKHEKALCENTRNRSRELLRLP